VKVSINPPVIAHRGASAYAPENTIAAFMKAIELGVKWIEFDVMSASCGKPIIFHDDELDRTTNANGGVSQFPYPYLATLDAGSWFDPQFSGERIPTLEATLQFLRESEISANVEIKALPGQEEALVKRVLEEIKTNLSLTDGRILFSSFSLDALRFLRKYSPDCLIGLLLHEWKEDWQKICETLNCVSLHVNHEIMTPAFAQQIKMQGLLLLCYTVNDIARARELFSFGVDAVFSDVPDKIIGSVDN
jgi:glycerophosphoryl diester phosphodiesterase